MDAAHRETECLIAEMEKKVRREYQKAAKETEAKLEDYLRRFKIKDEIWRRRVKTGEVSEAEYKQWRLGQIAIGQRWEDMKNQLASDMHNANGLARSIVQGYMPEVYALNHNFATYQLEMAGKVDTAYTLYSRETIERILREEPELLPMPGTQMKQTFSEWDRWKKDPNANIPEKNRKAFEQLLKNNKDVRWQKGQIQSCMLQGILQGESIPHMSGRIARELGEINHKATIRYARTAATAAQNAGRTDAYKRAEDLGVDLEQEWVATVDHRTRHEHRQLDGQKRKVGEPFLVDGYELMYPGDPAAEGFLIWNCRCTTVAVVKGWESHANRSLKAIEDEMTYEEWKESHDERPHSITKQEEIAEAMRWKYINERYRGK